jgi:hypothetical protein
LKRRFTTYLAAILGLALLASIGVVAHLEATVASADGFGQTRVTFTKWVTDFPPSGMPIANMVGVVGGDVGDGNFVGEVLTFDPTLGGGKVAKITADYHLNGSVHQSTVRLTVWQFNNKFAVLSGAVTGGWKTGALAYGMYQVIPCTQGVVQGGICYQGTLYVVGGGS